MAGHAQLKFVMTECSKTQICLTRHVYSFFCGLVYEGFHAINNQKVRKRVFRGLEQVKLKPLRSATEDS